MLRNRCVIGSVQHTAYHTRHMVGRLPSCAFWLFEVHDRAGRLHVLRMRTYGSWGVRSAVQVKDLPEHSKDGLHPPLSENHN